MRPHDDKLQLDASLAALDEQLAHALRAQAPDHLAQRILTATEDHLHQRLSEAMAVKPPAALAARVFDATAPMLPGNAVAGRVTWDVTLVRYAVAACLALAVGGAVWMQLQTAGSHAASEPSLADRLERVELAMNTAPDEFESRLATLALDVDETAWKVRVEPVGDMLDHSTGQLSEQLDMLEAQFGEF